MSPIAIRLITSIVGTVGFAMLFKISHKRMVWAALGGLFTCAVYELVYYLGADMLITAVIAATAMTLYSEAFARIVRAPALTFLLPCAVPIVPGSGLYYTIYNLLFYNEKALFENGKNTLMIILGMAVGMSVGSAIVGVILHISKHFNRKKDQTA